MFTQQNKIETAVIYDDHRFFGEAFQKLLETSGQFSEVFYFSAELDLMNFCQARNKGKLYLFLDFFIEKGNVLHLLPNLQKLPFDVRIIIVSSVENTLLIKKIFQHKVNGFISKIDGFEVINECILALSENRIYISPAIADLLTVKLLEEDHLEFTPRELEIISDLSDGHSTSEIAVRLNLSIHTVMTHRKNLMAKIGATNISQVIVFALRSGLIENN